MAGHSSSKDKDKFGDDGLLFVNENGHSMHFVLLMNDSIERKKLKRRIENRLGCVATTVEDIGPHSVVLTDLDNMKWKHDKVEKFKIGYISGCFDKGKILDLNKFICDTSEIYKKHFDYLKVAFDRVYTWDTIPQEFIKPTDVEVTDLESDANSDDSFMNTNVESPPRKKRNSSNKHTRDPYTRPEKEAIVKHIVERRLYDRVKGREMWQELERMNLCPKRTWQSMKEHAIKTISKEVTSFHFLTPRQRDKLTKALGKPKKT